MRDNRQRIRLTGFSIGWGIFILIVLLGFGNGIVRGVSKSYFREGDDVVTLTPGVTSMGFGGFNKDRRIVLTYDDSQRIQELMDGDIESTFPEHCIEGRVNYGNEYCNRLVWGEKPGFFCTLDQHIEYGRNISLADETEKRKVCVISRNTAKILFGKVENAVGQTVRIQETPFKVIGVYVTNRSYVINNDTYMPFATMQEVFIRKDELTDIKFKVREFASEAENEQFNVDLRYVASKLKGCSDQDMKAFKISNVYGEHLMLSMSLKGLVFFIWFMGLATLISGIVGISNIMSITVKERTREFGILKAMGASSRYILSMVLIEAVLIALMFGYIGLMLGLGVTQLLAKALVGADESRDNIISNPTLSLGLVGAVTLIIVFSGLIAGYIPARKAVKMKLIDSLSAI